jgi:hypothetical protein
MLNISQLIDLENDHHYLGPIEDRLQAIYNLSELHESDAKEALTAIRLARSRILRMLGPYYKQNSPKIRGKNGKSC